MAKEKVWLPEGVYVDFFRGVIYEGGRMMDMYRDIDTLPVFAEAGSIIPMTEEIDANSAAGNPASFILKLMPVRTEALPCMRMTMKPVIMRRVSV